MSYTSIFLKQLHRRRSFKNGNPFRSVNKDIQAHDVISKIYDR